MDPKDITAVLKEATKDLLTEQTLTEIKTIFESAVNKAADERAKLQVEAALDKQDADYTAKVEKVLAVVDVDHTNKLNRVVEAIDADRTSKLKKVINHYEKVLTEDAKQFKEDIINKLDKYLDLYLEEKIPQASIAEAVENVRSAKLVSQIRTMLGVDLAMATESIRDAVLDGKSQLEDYKKALAETEKKLKTLTESNAVTTANLLVETKTAALPEEKKRYMKKMLTGKDATYITENYDYVLDLFDKKEEEALETLKEQATQTSQGMNVDRPVVVAESTEQAAPQLDPMASMYVNELKKV